MEPSYNFNQIQRVDFLRNLFLGSLVPVVEVIMMLIMIEKFQAGLWEKTFLVIALKLSFLIGIPLSLFIFHKQIELNKSLVVIALVTSVGLLTLNYVHSAVWFIVLGVLISFPYHGIHPMLSEFYALYPQSSRGKRFVTSNMGLFLGSIIFTLLYNFILETYSYTEQKYDFIIYLTALGVLLSGLHFRRLPRLRFSGLMAPKFKTLFNIIKRDKYFLYVLFIWNMFGMANLWLMSYRTNILMEKQFGFEYDPITVLFLLTIVPEVTYLILNFPFALLFDRINFIALRIFFNILMLGYTFFFFWGTNYTDHLIGGICFGAFRAGGSLAWRLWVNKMVPKDKVSLYSTVHIGVTGIRMVIAPLVGLFSLSYLGPKLSASISMGLIALSIVLLLPLLPKGKAKFNF